MQRHPYGEAGHAPMPRVIQRPWEYSKCSLLPGKPLIPFHGHAGIPLPPNPMQLQQHAERLRWTMVQILRTARHSALQSGAPMPQHWHNRLGATIISTGPG